MNIYRTSECVSHCFGHLLDLGVRTVLAIDVNVDMHNNCAEIRMTIPDQEYQNLARPGLIRYEYYSGKQNFRLLIEPEKDMIYRENPPG